MAIPESIKQKANKIRNEVYGKDVREALASGIEEAGDIADQTRERQDSVEAQFQSVLDETTGKDVISAPEITAARVGADDTNHPNLKERLDTEYQKLSSQLAQIAVQVNSFPKQVPEDDDTGRIQRAIDSVQEGEILLFNGEYVFSSITVDKSGVKLIGNKAKLKVKDSNNKGFKLINADNFFISGFEMTVDFDGLPKAGPPYYDFFIHGTGKNVTVEHCKVSGLGLVRLNTADGAIIINNKCHSGTTSEAIINDGNERLMRGIVLENTSKFWIAFNEVYNYGQDGIKTQTSTRDGMPEQAREVGYIIYNYIEGITNQDAIDVFNNGSRLIIHGNQGQDCQKFINVKKEIDTIQPIHLNSFDNIVSNNIFKGVGLSSVEANHQFGIHCKSDNTLLANNILYDIYGQGIHVRENENTSLSNNIIHDIYSVEGSNIDTGVGIEIHNTARNVTIGPNDVHDVDFILMVIKSNDFSLTGGNYKNGVRGININPTNDESQVGSTVTGVRVTDENDLMEYGINITGTITKPIVVSGCNVQGTIDKPFNAPDMSNIKSTGNSWDRERITYHNGEVPQKGTFLKGDIIINTNVQSGGIAMQQCSVAGTNDNINTTGSIISGTNMLTVADASAMRKGMFITININGTLVHREILKINGTTITLSSNVELTGTNVPVTNKRAVFEPIATVGT